MTNKDLKRMIGLMGIKKPINEGASNSNLELTKKSPNGKFYAITKENKKYFIKESVDGINYDYIGGLGNKTKNQYNSYEEATKRLNIMFEDFNRSYGIQENNDILSSDLITEKKFVLKSKKKKSKPAEEVSFGTEESGGDNEFDFGGDEEETEEGDEEEEFDFGGDEEETEEGDDEDLDLEDDPIKDIQRMTGKLGQKIRDTEDLSSDTMKWVAKSVISALDLENMDNSDKKDIIRAIKKRKSEGSDEEFDFMSATTVENDDIGGDEVDPITVKRGNKYLDLILDDEYMPHSEDDNEMVGYPGMGDDWRKKSTDYMAKYTKYGDKVKGRGLEMHDVENIKSVLLRKLGGGKEYDVTDNEIEGTFGIIEISRDTLKLFLTNRIAYEELPEHLQRKVRRDLSKPIFYNFEEVSDLANDIKTLNRILSGESMGEDYMSRENYEVLTKAELDKLSYDEPYFDSDPAPAKPKTRPGTKPDTRPSTRPGTRPSPFAPPPYIEPGEEPAPKAGKKELVSYMSDDEYTTCSSCNGMHRDCDICGGSGIMPRLEAGGEVDEPFTMKQGGCQSYVYESRRKINTIRESLIDKMETYEQEQALMDVEEMAAKNGLNVGYCHKDRSSDVEEKTIYLELKSGNKVVGSVRINSVGEVEVGQMKNKNFTGQPLDSYQDFEEYLSEKDIFMKSPSEAPAKPKTRPSTKPDTRPSTRPGTKPSPFAPPPYIEPGEEPAPKASGRKRY